MKQLLLLTFSLCLAGIAQAQVDSTMTADSTKIAVDTSFFAQQETAAEQEPSAPPPFLQVSINLDYGKLGTTAANLDEKYEAGVTLLFFNEYYLLGELGKGVLSPENGFKNGTYTSEGYYYRAGGGLLKQINPKSKLGMGAMYGISLFEDRGERFLESPSGVQDDYASGFSRMGLSARWFEVILTSESKLRLNKQDPDAKINQLFSWGFYLRSRFLITYDKFPQENDVYTIPGYGRTVNNPNLAINLFIKAYVF